MPTEVIEDLTTRFAIPGHLSFEAGPGDLPVAAVQTPHAHARIALQGATVIGYQRRDHDPLLWVSRHSAYADDRAIRGGIPICWPWFGPHPTNTALPSHGFARTRPWTLLGTAVAGDGSTEVRLGLRDQEATRALWPHAFALELVVVVGASLRVSLTARNTGSAAFTCGGALHTYFLVGDVTALTIDGLDGCAYVDQVDGHRAGVQHGPLTISGETDRVYQGTTAPCTFDDPVLRRRVTVAKSGSHSTVVWNPWHDKAARLPDMGDDEYPHMVCVEVANALDDVVTVAPGGEHRLEAVITSDPLPA
ncbi:MAG: D-hexose-6-phosphate mutarotase [Chloroflexota bacterium]